MKKFRVIVPPVVQRQISEQFLYIAEDSMERASAWVDRLQKVIEKVGEYPVGHAVDEDASERMRTTIHKVAFERTYLIHHVVANDRSVVEVVNFRHGARTPRRGEP